MVQNSFRKLKEARVLIEKHAESFIENPSI
jgi:hypothetical protein